MQMPQQSSVPQQMQPGGMQPQQNPNIQAFLQMLQQQGFSPQSNLTNGGMSMPQQGMQPQQQSPMQPQLQTQQPQQMQPGGQPQIPPQMMDQLLKIQQLQQLMKQNPQMQRPQQGGQPQPQGQNRFTPQELGALGRMGDTTVAHLTPGEIAVPPQVQTPKVLATLKHAFHQKGAQPQNFVAGSPTSSHNPSTGMPEYNFWSSILPIALGGLGSMFLGPEVAALMGTSALGGSAIAGGLGTTLGGLIGGQDPLQAGLTGLGSGAGGYALGSLFGPASNAASSAANSTADSTRASAAQINPMSGGMSQVPSQSAAFQDVAAGDAIPGLTTGQRVGSGIGSAIGGNLAQSIFTPNATGTSSLPGFNTPYKNASQLPSWQQQLGQNSYNGPRANFTGYNPSSNYPAAFNFFPQQGTI